ncbi:P-loop containing nucleoside triphosphate hydrolase protein [Atractiella rhizophila]|nr:P-loop containing nucleoside triphosphate hydrolase protein [Atractiella rhizophila]
MILAPESTAGFFSRLCFIWYFPILWKGAHKPLTMDDLGDIDDALESTALWETGDKVWQKNREKNANRPLIRSLLTAFAFPLAAPVVPCLVRSLAVIAQPLLIGDLVHFISTYSTDDPQPSYIGWSLVSAFGLVLVIIALSDGMKQYAINRAQSVLRGFLIEAIYRKTLKLHISVAAEIGGGTAGNYMSVDVERIGNQQRVLHELYSAFVTIALGLLILYKQIKFAFIAPLVGAIVSLLLIPILSKNVGKAQAQWSTSIDERTKLIGSVLKNIKSVKLGAYEEVVGGKIHALKETEVKAYKYFGQEVCKTVVSTNWSTNFINLCTLIAYGVSALVSDDPTYQISPSKLFTVIATVSIIAEPLLNLGQSYNTVQGGFTLLLKEEKKYRTLTEDDEKKEKYEAGAVVIQAAAASFQLNGTTLLSEIDLHCRKGDVIMIIGRVGSGKSLLLQALLGELDLVDGTMSNLHAHGRIGYCSQNPWLRLAESVKSNIEFLSAPNPELYEKVVKAVALDVDFQILHRGDRTPASDLSGGQKARVALARLLFAQVDIALLDDVLSALDATTETHVFESLFGPNGLLKGKTVLMVTNAANRLRTADEIIMLQSCKIAETGKCDDLLEKGGVTSQFISEFMATSETDSGKEKKNHGEQKGKQVYGLEEEEEKDDEFEVRKVGFSTYWFYFGASGVFAAVIYFLLEIAATAINSSIPIYQQAWSKTTNPEGTLPKFIGGYAAIELAYLVALSLGIYYTIVSFPAKVSGVIHSRVSRGVLRTSMPFFDTNSFGKIINRFSQDIFVVDWELPIAVINTVSVALACIGSVILISVSVPYILIVFAAASILFWYIQRFYGHTSRMLRRLDMGSKSPLYSLFGETIDPNGLRTIRAFGGEETLRHLNSSRTQTSQKPFLLLNVARRWLTTSASLITTCINIALITLAVVLRDSASAALVAVALVQATELTTMLNHLLFSIMQAEILIIAMERLKMFSELPPEDTTALTEGSSDSAVSSKSTLKDWPAEGSVLFRIRGGQSLGVCGRTGSGKSTMLGALFRMLPVDEGGSISIDGIDISTVPLRTLRSNLTIIPQDPMMLELSLRENLDLEEQHTDDEIWHALERCQIKQAVERLPEKLDTVIKDGASFSRGESQLLALARALLRNSKIVAFDEATSSIDLQTQSFIQETLSNAFRESTIISIAHRISTILDHENTLVLDAGEVLEFGKTQALLAKEDGAFKRLVEAGLGH